MPVYELAEHRYTDRDVRESPRLAYIAEWYAKNYMGEFEFMRDMKEYVQLGNELNVSQVRAVMNCLRNDPHMACRVPSEVANIQVPEAKVLEFAVKTKKPYASASRRREVVVESPCGSKVSHEWHWRRVDDIMNPDQKRSVKCPGVPFSINRVNHFSTKARIKVGFCRARSSAVIHKVSPKEYSGWVDWEVGFSLIHRWGYGTPTLHVATVCSTPGSLQSPALYKEMPVHKELSEQLGIGIRLCKRCFSSDQES